MRLLPLIFGFILLLALALYPFLTEERQLSCEELGCEMAEGDE